MNGSWPPSHAAPEPTVVDALRAVAGDLDDASVRAVLGRVAPEDWSALALLAQHHRLVPRLMRLTDRERVPAPALGTLTFLATAHRVQTAVLRTELDRIIDGVDREGVDVVVLKGMVLQATCYPDPVDRPASDIDLLVGRDRLAEVASVLENLGYAQQEYNRYTGTLSPLTQERLDGYSRQLQHLGEYVRLDPSHGMPASVDLHFRLSTVFDHLAPSVDLLWEASVPWRGRARMLDPLDQVSHHCYHAWWDTQSVDNIRSWTDLRLSSFADIRRLVLHWNLSCGDILERASATGIADTVHWGLGTAVDLLGDLPGGEAVDQGRRAALDAGISDRWLQRDTGEPFATWGEPASERIFDPRRGERALTMLVDRYLRAHTRKGDRLKWVPVDE